MDVFANTILPETMSHFYLLHLDYKFKAKEYEVTVFAADLWIAPTENYEFFRSLGMEDQIFPIYADANALPFAKGFFDAIISVDAYHYFRCRSRLFL